MGFRSRVEECTESATREIAKACEAITDRKSERLRLDEVWYALTNAQHHITVAMAELLEGTNAPKPTPFDWLDEERARAQTEKELRNNCTGVQLATSASLVDQADHRTTGQAEGRKG